MHQQRGGEEECGGGKKPERPARERYNPQETVEEPQPIWEMHDADDTAVVSISNNILAEMMTVFAAVCASFGLEVS